MQVKHYSCLTGDQLSLTNGQKIAVNKRREELAENFAAMKNIKLFFIAMWSIIKQSFSDFIDNKVLKLSGALAFYTIFSLPAMLIIIISISDIFYGRDAVEGTLYNLISGFVGT